jgi:transcriptional regulator with XRE-family HTH domain
VRTQLAKNILLGRTAAGVTQDWLAEASGVSRATIAQLESAATDCRLTTLTDIARALGVSPILMLLQHTEISSLATWIAPTALDKLVRSLAPGELEQMNALRASGLQKSLMRVAQIAVEAVRHVGFDSRAAAIGASIGSGILPGLGTAVGTLVGVLLEDHGRVDGTTMADGMGI